jgi:putative endonuclease
MCQYVYLVECTDERSSFYIGYTTDLARRIREHNQGEGAKYTRGRTPVRLRYVELWDTQSNAMSREWQLKQRSRAEKERLVPEQDDVVAVAIDPPIAESA